MLWTLNLGLDPSRYSSYDYVTHSNTSLLIEKDTSLKRYNCRKMLENIQLVITVLECSQPRHPQAYVTLSEEVSIA